MNGKCVFRFVNRKTFFLDSNKNSIFARTVKTAISPNPLEKEAEEIIIPVPWGHIAGKWWGPKTKRPVLMLHGWQDNCGTFNTLVPHLNPAIGYLGIDFPGHGRSSHFPLGTYSLHGLENLIIIRRIVNHFKWDTVTIIAHSMGAINSYVYASVYLENIDLLIGLDSLKPVNVPPKQVMKYLARNVEEYFKVEGTIAAGNEPPIYTFDEAVERLHIGTNKSIAKDNCVHILERNMMKSMKDPKKYYFSRDSRLRARITPPIEMQLSVEMAKLIKCPMVTIKAMSGPYFEEKLGFYEIVDVLKEHNPLFQYVEMPGTHHLHLNEPEKVAPLINKYLNEYCQHLIN